jgi:hypothetical protein
MFLSGCTAVPPNAWRVAPIEYDNAMDGDPKDRTDVTYPMANITTDTAGGIWTESAGSWLHLDENGDTLRRFNAEMFVTVHGISAVSPTVLAVSRTDRENPWGAGSGLFLFDTDDETWENVEVDATTAGDVVVDAEGRIVFVDYLGAMVPGAMDYSIEDDAPIPFAIRAIDANGEQTTVLGEDARLSATTVAIDTDSAGTVYVSTDRETFSVGVDGTRSPIGTHAGRQPVLAVSPAGELLAAGSYEAGADVAWVVSGGSSEAKDVISQEADCARNEDGGLALLQAGTATSLPFTCGVRGAIWIDESTFIISVGYESGAVLAKVAPPVS